MTLYVIFQNYICYVNHLPVEVITNSQVLFESVYQNKVANVASINSLIHTMPTLAENVVNNMVPGPEDLDNALSIVRESEEEVKSFFRTQQSIPKNSILKNAFFNTLSDKLNEHLLDLQDLNETSTKMIENIKNMR